MKLKDIKEGRVYAAKLPSNPSATSAIFNGRHAGETVPLTVTAVYKNLNEVSGVYHSPTDEGVSVSASLTPRSILAPWADHVLNRDHEKALSMDAIWEDQREYERKEAAKR